LYIRFTELVLLLGLKTLTISQWEFYEAKGLRLSSKGKPEKKQEQGNNYLEDRNFNFHSNQLAE